MHQLVFPGGYTFVLPYGMGTWKFVIVIIQAVPPIFRCASLKQGHKADALHFNGIVQNTSEKEIFVNEIRLRYNRLNKLLLVSGAEEAVIADLYQINGKLLKRVNVRSRESFEINLNGYPGGIYIMRMILKSGSVHVEKINVGS
jgi:hypothetical protein